MEIEWHTTSQMKAKMDISYASVRDCVNKGVTMRGKYKGRIMEGKIGAGNGLGKDAMSYVRPSVEAGSQGLGKSRSIMFREGPAFLLPIEAKVILAILAEALYKPKSSKPATGWQYLVRFRQGIEVKEEWIRYNPRSKFGKDAWLEAMTAFRLARDGSEHREGQITCVIVWILLTSDRQYSGKRV
jgi:hypothetical protein